MRLHQHAHIHLALTALLYGSGVYALFAVLIGLSLHFSGGFEHLTITPCEALLWFLFTWWAAVFALHAHGERPRL